MSQPNWNYGAIAQIIRPVIFHSILPQQVTSSPRDSYNLSYSTYRIRVVYDIYPPLHHPKDRIIYSHPTNKCELLCFFKYTCMCAETHVINTAE
jgi:hypothetical protein